MTYLGHVTSEYFTPDGVHLGGVSDPVCIADCDNKEDAKAALDGYIQNYLNAPTVQWIVANKLLSISIDSINAVPQEDFEVLRKYLPVVSK